MQLSLVRHESPIGAILTVTDADRYMRALDFLDHESRMHRLLRLHYGTYVLNDGPGDQRIAAGLAAYFEGYPDALGDLCVRTANSP